MAALCLCAAHAAAPTALVNDGERTPLQGSLDFLVDRPGLEREQLAQGFYDNEFHRYDDRIVNFQRHPVWLRMHISNSSQSDRLVLSVDDVLFTEAELLYSDSSDESSRSITTQKTGMLHPYIQKNWHYHDIAFLLNIRQDSSKTIYLRLSTPFFMLLDPYVADEMTYSAYQAAQASWGHLMVGIMLGVLLYLAMIALYVRGISEVRHCIAFVSVSFLVLLFGRGYLFGVLPDNAWLNTHLYPLIFSAQAFTYIAFSRRHFKTHQDFPLTDKALLAGEYFSAMQLFASLVVPLEWSVMAVGISAFILIAMLCIASVYIWANSTRRLTVYIFGTLSFLLVCILATAENCGFISLNGKGRSWYEAGLCLQTILFALALAEKINDYQREQTRLAVRAAEATAESRAKSSFLAKMSHELRTPMNGLLGMLQLMDHTTLNDEQRHYMHVMRNSGRMLLGVIDDVLDYSRIMAGKLRIETCDFDLTEVLSDVEALFAQTSRQKQLDLRFSINANTPLQVHGDPIRFRQILINLVSNAIKFTHAGSIAVRCRVEKCGDSEWLLHSEVEDTGIGISTEQMKLLFHEYAQAGHGKSYGGSGLGLAICKQLTEIMGGAIQVESAPDYGSLFRFHIQVTPPHAQTLQQDSHTEANPGDRDNSPKARILVAEDNETNREVIISFLQRLGHHAECVNTGIDAVNRVCSDDERWGLVLMDIEMPLMDGLVATRKIRSWEQARGRAALPIIALTAHAIRGYEDRARESGMNDHLSKPIELNKLRKTIEKWLISISA